MRSWFYHMVTVVVLGMALMPVGPAHGASVRELVKEGNAAYAAGRFDEALSSYEEATVELAESPELYFNKGAAHYRKEEYAEAREAFELAGLKSREPQLESRSQFNLGNCAFREGERQRDGDLKKSLALCEESIVHYQRALELEPEFAEAAENIEVVRLVIKSILDEIKKQQEDAEAKQDAVEKLKELAKRQRAAWDRGKALTAERQEKGDSPDTQQQIGELTAEQNALGSETRAVAEGLSQAEPSPPLDEAKQHLDEAVGAQAAASEKLGEQDTEGAGPDQQTATEALEKALAALAGEQQQEQQKQSGDDQEQSDQQEQKEDQEQDQESSDQQQPQKQEGQDAAQDEEQPEDENVAAQLPDEARDILDEEKENKEQREVRQQGGYRPVDKDW